MYSAFGVDHGQSGTIEIEKGFLNALGGAAKKFTSMFSGGGAHAADVGRHAGAPRAAGGARRAAGLPKVFGSSGGARKAAPGGARIPGAHAAPGQIRPPAMAGGARKAGEHAAGRRKAY